MGALACSKHHIIKNYFIKIFCYFYKINMLEAIEEQPLNYASFHDFFIRRLKEAARPIDQASNTVASPADGTISQQGILNQNQLVQAKGQTYTLDALLANDQEWAKKFQHGLFQTIYLAPHNYHRVHMPVAGVLKKMIYVPGKLFSVSLFTAEHVPDLFVKNERVVCFFDTELGPMAVILVGAMIVGSIHTVWAGKITPKNRSHKNQIESIDYPIDNAIKLEKGAELGYFSLGSTVITLFSQDKISWLETLNEHQSIQMGEKIANGNRV